MTAIAVAHHVPYAAQAAATHWHDLSVKVERAAAADGPAFLNVLTDCPLGWGHEPRQFAQVMDAAVDCLFWPLYEVVDGDYRLDLPPGEGRSRRALALPPAALRASASTGEPSRRRADPAAGRDRLAGAPGALPPSVGLKPPRRAADAGGP